MGRATASHLHVVPGVSTTSVVGNQVLPPLDPGGGSSWHADWLLSYEEVTFENELSGIPPITGSYFIWATFVFPRLLHNLCHLILLSGDIHQHPGPLRLLQNNAQGIFPEATQAALCGVLLQQHDDIAVIQETKLGPGDTVKLFGDDRYHPVLQSVRHGSGGL